MEQTDIEELIAEELLGNTLTEEERRQLEAWLEADPAHAEWYARIREARFSTFRYETYSHIDSYKAYEHFLKKTRRTSWLKRYARTVAACLIPIFLIGGALWVNHYYKPVSKPATAVVPGGTRAVLETAAGESIMLDSDMLSRQPSISLANASVSTSARGIRLQPDTTVRYAVSSMGQNTLRTAENGNFSSRWKMAPSSISTTTRHCAIRNTSRRKNAWCFWKAKPTLKWPKMRTVHSR